MARLATELCDAGRTAFFGGKWKGIEPCPEIGRHHIASPSTATIHLCDEHFAEVSAAGLVTEPFVAEEEWHGRRADRPSKGLARFNGGPLDGRSVMIDLPAPAMMASHVGAYIFRDGQNEDGPTFEFDWKE